LKGNCPCGFFSKEAVMRAGRAPERPVHDQLQPGALPSDRAVLVRVYRHRPEWDHRGRIGGVRPCAGGVSAGPVHRQDGAASRTPVARSASRSWAWPAPAWPFTWFS